MFLSPLTAACCFSLGLHPPWFPAYPLFICSFDLRVVTAPADTDSRWPGYHFLRLKPLPLPANSGLQLVSCGTFLDRPSVPLCRGSSPFQVPAVACAYFRERTHLSDVGGFGLYIYSIFGLLIPYGRKLYFILFFSLCFFLERIIFKCLLQKPQFY